MENVKEGEQLANPATTAVDTFDDLVADAGRGTEKIGINDVKPPRLLICQSGSPQRKPDNVKQIPGLNELDLFNSVTGQIYGRTVLFVVIAQLGTHWIEFDKDLKVVDGNVPEGDPRTLWGPKDPITRKSAKPVATQFYDYIVFLPEHRDTLVFSLKSTQITVAKDLNGQLLAKLITEAGTVIENPPAWAKTYRLSTTMQEADGKSWGGFNVTRVEITHAPLRLEIRKLADRYSKVNIVVDRDETDAVDDAAAAGGNGGGQGDPDDM